MVTSSENGDGCHGPTTADQRLHGVLPADPIAAGQSRAALRTWLTAHRWPTHALEDLVLAVSEAVSNAIEHGYGAQPGVSGRPGTVELDGEVACGTDGMRHAEITVRDHGEWRSRPVLPSNRRRGIPTMRACVAECVIDGTATGTIVFLRSRTVPA